MHKFDFLLVGIDFVAVAKTVLMFRRSELKCAVANRPKGRRFESLCHNWGLFHKPL